MPSFTPFEATIEELQAAMASDQITAVGLTEYYLARIQAYDGHGPTLNAIRAVNETASDAAMQLDKERHAGQLRGPLHGIPVVVKDNYETVDMTTTAGSVLLRDFKTHRDATLVAKLRAAGAIVLAKANMHEFAYGITTFGSLFGQTKNPYDLTRNAGGSSGGTASAVAANFAAVGMGSDTCGSIRIPAAHNNLVGLRGSQGLSSRFGIVPLSHSHDIGGPIARCVKDLAIVLDVTVGFDPNDLQTADSVGQIPASYTKLLDAASLAGKRIGLLTQAMKSSSTDDEVSTVIRASLDRLADQADIIEIDMPQLDELLFDPTGGFLVLSQDFKWDIADYLSAQPGAPVTSLAEIIASGACHPALADRLAASEATEVREGFDYLKELARRRDVRRGLLATIATHQLDALVYPTIRQLPVALGEFEQPGSNCRISAKSGLPAISLPAGFSLDGLPIGMELLGAAWSEAKLLGMAGKIEAALGHRRPPESVPPNPA